MNPDVASRLSTELEQELVQEDVISNTSSPDDEIIFERQRSLHEIQSHTEDFHPRERILYSQLIIPLLLELLATVVFVLTTWTAQATFSSNVTVAGFTIDISSTLTLLRILQGLLSTLVTLILSEVFPLIYWTLTAREGGLHSISLLGLSPTTGAVGALRILLNRGSRIADRAWPLLRFTLAAALWISGVVLFANTSLAVVYDHLYTYEVTAGVGQFNSSLVQPYFEWLHNTTPEYPYRIVPYSAQSIVYNLVVNSMQSVASTPVGCTQVDCDSYLLTGGLMMTTPWAPSDYPSAPVVQIPDVLSCQIDFRRGLGEGEIFSDEDCSVFGDDETLIGIRFCVGNSRTMPGSITAGLYVCPHGSQDIGCRMANSTLPNITSTFSVFSRKATVVVARSNLSIISVTSVGRPTQNTNIDLDGFRNVLSWILNYNASKIPPPTSIAQEFWSGTAQLSNTYWSPELLRMFQSILVFPLWAFNANNFGSIDTNPQQISNSMPPDFYTKASIAVPHTKVVISPPMFVTFIVLQSILHLFVWGVFAWILFQRPFLPRITSYPLFDFAFKTKYQLTSLTEKEDPNQPRGNLSTGMFEANDGDVLSTLSGLRYFLYNESNAYFASHGPIYQQLKPDTSTEVTTDPSDVQPADEVPSGDEMTTI